MKLFSRLLSRPKQTKLESKWLSSSESLEDVERRQKAIAKGKAPWNVRARAKLMSYL